MRRRVTDLLEELSSEVLAEVRVPPGRRWFWAHHRLQPLMTPKEVAQVKKKLTAFVKRLAGSAEWRAATQLNSVVVAAIQGPGSDSAEEDSEVKRLEVALSKAFPRNPTRIMRMASDWLQPEVMLPTEV